MNLDKINNTMNPPSANDSATMDNKNVDKLTPGAETLLNKDQESPDSSPRDLFEKKQSAFEEQGNMLAPKAKKARTATTQKAKQLAQAKGQATPNTTAVASKKNQSPQQVPTTDLSKDVPFVTKTGTIDLGDKKVKVATEQRVAKKAWWNVFGPKVGRYGKVWNGVVNKLHRDILSGKHAKGVEIKGGKIKVTDPILKNRLNMLLSSYKTMSEHNGRKVRLPDGQVKKINVNEKTRQAFTLAMLHLIRHGVDHKESKAMFESNFANGRDKVLLFFDVTGWHNQYVNRTVQKSKGNWETGV